MKHETPRPPLSRGCTWLVAGILGASGLALLALGLCLWVPAQRSNSWPTVSGLITGHRIESSRYGKKLTYDYTVGVDYVYEVERIRHTGHSFSHAAATLPLPSYKSREAAEAAYASEPSFRDWQAGQRVTVFYDPTNPADSVLQKGVSRLGLSICLLATGMLGAAAWEGWKLRRRAATS